MKELVKKIQGKGLGYHTLLSFSLNGLGVIILFGQQIVFTRVLDVVEFGQFSFIGSIVVVMGIFTKWGMLSLSSRELNRLSDRKQINGFYRFSFAVIIVFTLLIGVIGWVVLPYLEVEPKFQYINSIFWFVIFWFLFKSLLELWSKQYQAVKQTIQAKLSLNIVPPIVGMLMLFSYHFFIEEKIALFRFYQLLAISMVVSMAIMALIKTPKIILFWNQKAEYLPKIWLSTGFYLLLLSSVRIVMKKLNVFLVGFYDTMEQVGFYNIAVSLSGLAIFGLTAANQVIAPMIAKSYYDGNTKKFNESIILSIKIGTISTLVLTLPLIIWGESILGIYGIQYESAYYPLIILAIAQFFSSLCGPVGYSLTMSGNEKIVLMVLVASLVINVILAFILIPVYGIIGAAISNSIGIIFWNITLVLYTNFKLDYDTSIMLLIRKK